DNLVQNIPHTDHPIHPSFPEVIIDNKSYSVQIISQIGVYLLWEVILSDEQGSHEKAYVKAVRKHQYSLDTHQLLANNGYAPKVLASSIIPGNWCLVYIECLDNYSMLHRITLNLNDQERNCLKEKIEKAVEYLHNLGHVHGDLREGNILVGRLEDNDFDVKLIDFEWSGKAGFACYSYFMNHKNIQWPDGAEDGKL
ncbi:11111_t:CDS:1, partial [Cetraspora pellucida]